MALNLDKLYLTITDCKNFQILDLRSRRSSNYSFPSNAIIISHKIPHRIFPSKEEVGCKLSYLHYILGGAYSTPYF